jgi:hypothetical protein
MIYIYFIFHDIFQIIWFHEHHFPLLFFSLCPPPPALTKVVRGLRDWLDCRGLRRHFSEVPCQNALWKYVSHWFVWLFHVSCYLMTKFQVLDMTEIEVKGSPVKSVVKSVMVLPFLPVFFLFCRLMWSLCWGQRVVQRDGRSSSAELRCVTQHESSHHFSCFFRRRTSWTSSKMWRRMAEWF